MTDATANISVIIITLNEERNIADCLRSVDWSDDIVVVDACSSDRTVELARQFTSKVFVTEWKGYAEAKTFALQNTSHDWVLWLDADERVTSELATQIQEVIGNSPGEVSGYEVARRAYFLGKWIRHCGWYPGYVVRLFRKSRTRFANSQVHERLEVNGMIGRLHSDIEHFTDETLYHYLAKFNRYTSLAADDLKREGKRSSLYDLFVRPPYLFIKMFVLRGGFLDGKHGLILSTLSAAYVFCKYAKRWEAEIISTNNRY